MVLERADEVPCRIRPNSSCSSISSRRSCRLLLRFLLVATGSDNFGRRRSIRRYHEPETPISLSVADGFIAGCKWLWHFYRYCRCGSSLGGEGWESHHVCN